MERLRLKIGGESGSGLLTCGELIINSLNSLGLYVVADREYASLIKGVPACYTINVSTDPIYSVSDTVDLFMAIDKASLVAYADTLRDEGVLVHGYERLAGLEKELEEFTERGVQIVHQPARQIAFAQGGNALMSNIVLIGMVWKTLGLELAPLRAQVEHKFASKPKLLEIDLLCLEAGYESVEPRLEVTLPESKPEITRVPMDGNKALALGAVQAGVRAYYAYPMSPSSTILHHLAAWADHTGMVVKQAEDEITSAEMTLGSMHMGTRALLATSGGGIDLMTETISLAGMIEVPFVLIDAQRPGPATGLPTWTGQGDFNLAAYSAHGDFAKVVIGVSNPEDCYELIQHAFNIAEQYQCVVIVLTEKVIAEAQVSTPRFQEGIIPIERGLVAEAELDSLESRDRFAITESGLSKRWLPGSSDTYYFANGDEHGEDGSLSEDAEPVAEMYAKRMRKQELIKANLPEPKVYGPQQADISFVGWGSSNSVMHDILKQHEQSGSDITVNYLHIEYMFPLRTEVIQQFFATNSNVHLIEGNYTGQLGKLIEAEAKVEFAGKVLKYDGRPFFLEDVQSYIKKNMA